MLTKEKKTDSNKTQISHEKSETTVIFFVEAKL